MVPLPSLASKVVDTLGKLLAPWNSYLQQFTQAPPGIMGITIGLSPFDYIVEEPGTIIIVGGTLTDVSLIRGSDTLAMGNAARIIPVGIQDTVRVTYSIVPTSITFIPAYGQNTTS